ncbi:MAG: 1-acyl-sn-glycerol-3-phosphate acyltransferase [Planctomycetes bacterium]|nr:1-acyl-sn-glycerol-3-phosphate acyltransferase [Planctomycetota bacterium]
MDTPTEGRPSHIATLPPTPPYALGLRVALRFNAALCRFWYGLRRIGPCTVPADGPVIIAANHHCTADPLMLTAACPSRAITYLIAREYAHTPIFGYFVRLLDCIQVRRDGRDLTATKTALRRLRQGYVLGIFIEGRITPPGETPVPKDGVALLALRSRATVIPAYIGGTLYRADVAAGFFARHRARVRFGNAVDLTGLTDRPGRAAVAEATRRIYERICALRSE